MIWLLFHKAVPTNFMRLQRHLAALGTCSRCNNSDETMLPCFRDCTQPIQSWAFFGFGASLNFWVQDLTKWLISNLRPMGDEFRNPILFVFILWWIWRSRNKEVFGHIKIPTMGVVHRVRALADTCSSVFLINSPSQLKVNRWVQ